jgi:ABC-type branched-subunit amino acid transport system substrate-binding protein
VKDKMIPCGKISQLTAKRKYALITSVLLAAFLITFITILHLFNSAESKTQTTKSDKNIQTENNTQNVRKEAEQNNINTEGSSQQEIDLSPYGDWVTFTENDGLPSNKIFCVRIDGERVWAGTDNGLALYEKGKWRTFGTDDGIPYKVILSLDVSPRTGDLWIGTMGGLARYSGGRFDAFTQMNSGLPNDFVHSVKCDPYEDTVWVATAMGAGRLNLHTGEWSGFDHTNTPMHEPWTYSVTAGKEAVYIAAWGGGVLEYTKATGRWREYRDPDKEFEIDLLPDDGPPSDVTTGIDLGTDKLWVSTYSGGSYYDGRMWQTFYEKEDGLSGNFIQFVRAQGSECFFATDKGVSQTDGERWIVYRRLNNGQGETLFYRDKKIVGRHVSSAAIAHNYILGLDVKDNAAWIATEKGLSRGMRYRLTDMWKNPAEEEAKAASSAVSQEMPAPAKRFTYAGTPDILKPFPQYIPYKDFFVEPAAFPGAGREKPEPEGLKEVKIGFIGPVIESPAVKLPKGSLPPPSLNSQKIYYGEQMIKGALLAVEEANAGKGYKGIPFSIVPRTDLVLWGQTSNELVKFAYENKVWSILSAVDSNHVHVLIRAALKAEVVIVNAASTAPDLSETALPWLVRVMRDDRQNAYALLNEIFIVKKHKRIALLRVNDREGRTGVNIFVKGATRLGHPIVIEKRFFEGDADFQDQIEQIMNESPDGIVLLGEPLETGLIVKQMREMGIDLPVYGFDHMAQPLFLQTAGMAAEGVTLVTSLNPESTEPQWQKFAERYRKRWGDYPDTFSAHSYDGMNLIIKAIRAAGLNRILIRDYLFSLKTYNGVSGDIIFDSVMDDISPPWLTVVKGGRFHYYPAPKWSNNEEFE